MRSVLGYPHPWQGLGLEAFDTKADGHYTRAWLDTSSTTCDPRHCSTMAFSCLSLWRGAGGWSARRGALARPSLGGRAQVTVPGDGGPERSSGYRSFRRERTHPVSRPVSTWSAGAPRGTDRRCQGRGRVEAEPWTARPCSPTSRSRLSKVIPGASSAPERGRLSEMLWRASAARSAAAFALAQGTSMASAPGPVDRTSRAPGSSQLGEPGEGTVWLGGGGKRKFVGCRSIGAVLLEGDGLLDQAVEFANVPRSRRASGDSSTESGKFGAYPIFREHFPR